MYREHAEARKDAAADHGFTETTTTHIPEIKIFIAEAFVETLHKHVCVFPPIKAPDSPFPPRQ